MKIQLFFCLIIINTFLVCGQENQKLCVQYHANIENCIKNDKCDDAQKNIALVIKNCPSANENFYINAEKIYLKSIEFSKKKENKIQTINDLIKLYDVYDKKFPENKNGNPIKKALYIYDNQLDSKTAVFNILDKYFKTSNANYNNPRALYIYYELYVNEFKNPKPILKIEDLISKFIVINAKNLEVQNTLSTIIKNLKEKQKTASLNDLEAKELDSKSQDLQAYILVQEASKGLLEPYLSAENLKIYANKYFEEKKNNDAWLKFVSNEMFLKNCYANEIFTKLATATQAFNPTSKSNFYLGYVSVLKDENPQAEIYFNTAADLENNSLEKANIYCTIANTVFGANNNQKALEYLNKAAAADANFAKPHLIISQMFQDNINDCAKTDFEKKAFNWLIINQLEKAIKAEPYLKQSIEKQIVVLQQKLPSKNEISESKMAGKTINFTCFINDSVMVPNN